MPRPGIALVLLVLTASPAVAAAPGVPSPPQHEHPAPPEGDPEGEPDPEEGEEEGSPKGRQPRAGAEPTPQRHPPTPAMPPAHREPMGDHAMVMPGLLGPYPAGREASGTSWQPEATPHEARHGTRGPWSWMAHARAHAVYTHQGGGRGEEDVYSTNMAMGALRRPLGHGTLGLRGMLSLEPTTVGEEGYPLLLQTGETADGVSELVDRQHPHDLFMELAATYSRSLGAEGSVYVYAGLPGEPALGPPAYPHRFSAFESPEAPLAHHWLDSTHITFGVVTAGWIRGPLKLEASAFRGAEPDEERWDLEAGRLDSWSARVSWNPGPSWALQASRGRLEAPEQLEPEVDTVRSTLSVIRHGAWQGGMWQATLAWGRNANDPGQTLDALLLEGTARLAGRHTLFARAERVENDELLPPGEDGDELAHGEVFRVGAASAGYLFDLLRGTGFAVAVGGIARLSLVPRALEAEYGDDPFSWSLVVRTAVR
jgi:hypothetical protein